jgi:hypothetical protein
MLHNPFGQFSHCVLGVLVAGLFAVQAMALPLKTRAVNEPLQYLEINQQVKMVSHGNGWTDCDNHGMRCKHRNSESHSVHDIYSRHYAWWLTPGVTYGKPSIPIYEYSSSPMQNLANCYRPYDARIDFWVRFSGQERHCVAP